MATNTFSDENSETRMSNVIIISSDSESEDEQGHYHLEDETRIPDVIIISSDSESEDEQDHYHLGDETRIPDVIIISSNSESEDEQGHYHLEDETQIGRGQKRIHESDDNESESEDEQGQYYYELKSSEKYHSKKFNMTATDHRVQFNNVLADFDLLQSYRSTMKIFHHLLDEIKEGMTPDDKVRFYTTFRTVGHTYFSTVYDRRTTYHRTGLFTNRTRYTIESGIPFK